jgi:hypothetical protein
MNKPIRKIEPQQEREKAPNPNVCSPPKEPKETCATKYASYSTIIEPI